MQDLVEVLVTNTHLLHTSFTAHNHEDFQHHLASISTTLQLLQTSYAEQVTSMLSYSLTKFSAPITPPPTSSSSPTRKPKNTHDRLHGRSTPRTKESAVVKEAAHYKHQLDQTFFECLDKIFSNDSISDANGNLIHNTPPHLNRVPIITSTTPKFMPLRIRINAFINFFLKALHDARISPNFISLKEARDYVHTHACIKQCSDSGKKIRSNGNYVWVVEIAISASPPPPSNSLALTNDYVCQYNQRVYKKHQNKFMNDPPAVARAGSVWKYTPVIWDPFVSTSRALFHSPHLPHWLSWQQNNSTLQGIPPSSPDPSDFDDAKSTFAITILASYYRGDERRHLSDLYDFVAMMLERTFTLKILCS